MINEEEEIMTRNEILSYNEIKETTIWVAKMTWGRQTGTYDELTSYREDEECRDFDIVAKQPTEKLQHFWDAFDKFAQDYSFSIFSAEEFYNLIYSKCPYAFDKKPEIREKVASLSEVVANHSSSDDVIVEGCGNHRASNWVEALKQLDRDYDVINITKKHSYMCYTVAGTEEELERLSVVSNDCACREVFASFR